MKLKLKIDIQSQLVYIYSDMTLTITNNKNGRSKELRVKSVVLDKGIVVVTLADGEKMTIDPSTMDYNGAITYTFS